MEKHVEALQEKLSLKNEWEVRKAAMHELASLVARGASMDSSFNSKIAVKLRSLLCLIGDFDCNRFSALLKPLVPHLEAQLSDRRSIIVKEVCAVV